MSEKIMMETTYANHCDSCGKSPMKITSLCDNTNPENRADRSPCHFCSTECEVKTLKIIHSVYEVLEQPIPESFTRKECINYTVNPEEEMKNPELHKLIMETMQKFQEIRSYIPDYPITQENQTILMNIAVWLV